VSANGIREETSLFEEYSINFFYKILFVKLASEILQTLDLFADLILNSTITNAFRFIHSHRFSAILKLEVKLRARLLIRID